MIIVDNIFVPRQMLTLRFTCPYSQCGSMCCVSGEKGPPVQETEVQRIDEYLPEILPNLDKDCAKWLSKTEIYEKEDGRLNLQCLNNEERCVFSIENNNSVTCYLETFSRKKNLATLRPVSCRLFPIRTRQYNGLEVLDYEIWEECKNAWNKGEYLMDFCRDALIDSFGQQWIDKLDKIRSTIINQSDSE